MYLIPVSYMGSGSSALTDLLGEVSGITVPQESFEFVFLHCPGGLFDLEDKLLVGNNALRSDEALHTFAQTMQALVSDRWWVGHYHERLHSDFEGVVNRFLDQLIEAQPDFYWYQQEHYPRRAIPYLALRGLLRRVTGGRVQLKRPLTHTPMWLAWPSPQAFYEAAQQFVREALDQLPRGKVGVVLDQLLLPHNLARFDQYFAPGDAMAFEVCRDPRDVYLSNRFIWAKRGEPVPYPTDVDAFCSMYRRIRACAKPSDSAFVHRLAFEDLIYRYEETTQKLANWLGLPDAQKAFNQSRFDPKRSILNTQLFTLNDDWQAYGQAIASRLPEYLYDFPHPRPHHSDEAKIF